MSKRAMELAGRLEKGARELEAFAKGLTDAQWKTVVAPDGRQVGVIIHHVASMYPIEVHVASEVASGHPIEGLTWGVVADMNAKHAAEQGAVTKADALELLRKNAETAQEVVRAFTDEQLDRAVPVSLYGGAPLTTQFIIEDHALRHSWHHLAKISAALKVA
ncbi:MAG TPA: DinB family protein [Holophagaceae bacterium]|nr:DinB family protein [Holophagaceae bacterium]